MSHTYSPTRSAYSGNPETKVSPSDPNALTPRQEKHAEYVFRVLHRSSTTTAASTEQLQGTNNSISQIKNVFNKYAANSHSAPSEEEPQLEKPNSLQEENQSLRAEVQILTEQNKRLKDQCVSVEALQGEKAELQREIERIKNEYIQTSLDAFQESLRPHLQNISILKAALDSQNILRESLQDALSESHTNNLSLVADFKATVVKLEGEMRGQQQRFQVQLSDRDNQIHDLQRSLSVIQQKYSFLESELRTKDAFLLSLGQPRK